LISAQAARPDAEWSRLRRGLTAVALKKVYRTDMSAFRKLARASFVSVLAACVAATMVVAFTHTSLGHDDLRVTVRDLAYAGSAIHDDLLSKWYRFRGALAAHCDLALGREEVLDPGCIMTPPETRLYVYGYNAVVRNRVSNHGKTVSTE
jgi:hypothetical protein